MALKDLFKRAKTDKLEWEISKRNIPTHTRIFKFGENPSIGTTLVTIWDGDGNIAYPSNSGEILSLSSDNLEDSVGGDGAEKVILFGNDENFNLQSEIVELAGLSPVYTVKLWTRVWRMIVLPGQQGPQDAIGTIYAGTGIVDELGVPENVHAQIINGNNQTLMSVFTIPNGYRGLLCDIHLNVGEGKSALVKIIAREQGMPFTVQGTARLFENNIFRHFETPIPVAPKTDIQVKAKSTAAGTEISCDFILVLYKINPQGTDYVHHQDVVGWEDEQLSTM